MAYSFDGSTQYLSLNQAVAQGVPMTICCWFYRTLDSVAQRAVSVGQASPTVGHRHAVGTNSANTATAFTRGLNSGTQTNRAASTTVNTSLNTWEHYVGIYTSLTSRTIYLNGSNNISNTNDLTSYNTFTQTIIGANDNGGMITSFAGGLIAEVGFWNVTLSNDEIVSLSKGFACNRIRPQSLVFYAPLTRNLADIKEGRTITNNNTATVANHPRIYY